MAITFHCEHCGKKIEAKDAAGGNWGACPACHNKVYVPDLSAKAGEELKLVPIDENEVNKQKRLMAETYQLTQNILLERETHDNPTTSVRKTVKLDDKELTNKIITYLRQMADGQLNQAKQTANLITQCGTQAMNILDRIAISDMPEPQLAHIPPQVLSGLIRTLRSKIN